MKMIDVGDKNITSREAIARARLFCGEKIITAIKKNKIPKGDVIEAAKLAGILAAKNTPQIIPLCHPLRLNSVKVEIKLQKKEIVITTAVKAKERTGVEMEALVSAAVSALTIYDMCKVIDKGMVIKEILLLEKKGGRSGHYIRKNKRG